MTVIDQPEPRTRPFFLAYRPTLPRTWWMRNRRYTFFGLRELTAIPVGLWLLSLLYELSRVGAGPNGYAPSVSPLYVAFSVVCFIAAVLHSITWLNLSGVILRIKMGEKDVPPRTVTLANYAQWAVVTVVVAVLLIYLSTWRS
jgi:fumarate reductase subunit C